MWKPLARSSTRITAGKRGSLSGTRLTSSSTCSWRSYSDDSNSTDPDRPSGAWRSALLSQTAVEAVGSHHCSDAVRSRHGIRHGPGAGEPPGRCGRRGARRRPLLLRDDSRLGVRADAPVVACEGIGAPVDAVSAGAGFATGGRQKKPLILAPTQAQAPYSLVA